MASIIEQLGWFGATVRGPQHIHDKMPNQDAWHGQKTRSSAWISVCDGMGSRPNAETGSQTACIALRDAIRIWSKGKEVPVASLLRLIKLAWEIKLSPLKVEDCATTCLFAVALPGGRLVIAGLGDGIAAIRLADGSVMKVVERGDGFGNETLALGVPHRLTDWKIYEMEQFPAGSVVLLASDGVADDLQPDKTSEFIDWVMQEHSAFPPRQHGIALRRMLVNWPTPLHQDDKTLALIYRLPEQLVEKDR